MLTLAKIREMTSADIENEIAKLQHELFRARSGSEWAKTVNKHNWQIAQLQAELSRRNGGGQHG